MSNGPEVDNFKPLLSEDLRTSEMRYRRLFESARDGILILDSETRKITDVNPFMMELLDYNRDDFIGKELWEIGLLKDEKENITAFKKLQDAGYIRYDDLPLETKHGKRREVEFVSNVYEENGRQVVQCNIRDVTERKVAEAAQQKAETNYRNLVESAPGIVYLVEPFPPYSTVYVSPNIKIYGYSSEEWCATPAMWLSIVHKEDYQRVLHEYNTAWERGLDTELEYRIVARDGTIHWWQDKGRFVLDEHGNRTGWQGIILDITTTKQLEEQLRQSHKLESVGLLAGGIAHDFNNMLTAINGYSELTLRRLADDSPLHRNIEEILKAGQRAAELTQQLLAFSRQQVLQPIVLNINETILSTIKMLQRVIGENIQLNTALNHNLGRVMADPGQFSQIIMNLMVNARDAMPNGGQLTIETNNVFLDAAYTRHHVKILPGAYVQLSVSDTGMGMSEETQRHIFDPFFTTKEIGQGTGLGLSTVYGIVKQSGGNIEVYSEAGIGTTFKIYLPRVMAEIGETNINENDSEMPEGNETILLVEDEEMVRNLSREVLESCGYTVIEAKNGIDALEICDKKDCEFDLLLTDVIMPQMGGRELAEKLKIRFPNLRILFTSGYTTDAVVRHDVIEANTNFIQKPFMPWSLANKVRQILDDPGKEN